MKSSLRQRLPVTKPTFDHQKKRSVDQDELSEQSDSPRSAKQATLKRARPSSLTSESSPVIPFANSVEEDEIQIKVALQEYRPFELGDLLTPQFVARNSSFLFSLAFHTLALLLLSLVLIHSTGKTLIMLELLSSPDVEQYDGIVAEVDLSINDLEELVAASEQDPFDSAFGDDDGDQSVIEKSPDSGIAGGGNGTHGKGDGQSAKFFGMRAVGNKFVYVLDHSGSMAYESTDVKDYRVSRFDVARLELINSVESLRPHQEFYVVLFSAGMEQMFNKNALVPTPVKATPENKARLKEWLWQDQAVGGTDPRSSLKMAFKMNPDAIFMLSDGEFRDEKRDGNPLAIDITRKQIEEESPIRINSIALEDDASKANMEELSTVSGGQFKFVKVKDYISNLATSPADLFRSRVPLQPQDQPVGNWTERIALAKKLIPLLNSETQSDRKASELRLHELSFGIFESIIPAVADPNIEPATKTSAIAAWNESWTMANDKISNGGRVDVSTPIGLFSMLANNDRNDFVESIGSLDVRSLSPRNQIALARGILEYQQASGEVSMKTRSLLMDVLRELNKESTAKFDEDSFLKRATLATCKRRLETVLKNRRLRASRIYGKTKNKRLLKEVRVEFAKDLVALYPETTVAKKAAEELNLPVSHSNSTD